MTERSRNLILHAVYHTAMVMSVLLPGTFPFSILAQAPQVLWSKNYGGSSADHAYDIQALADGGYIVCGSTSSADGDVGSNYGGTDAWLLRTDASGNLLWQKNFGGSGDDVFKAVHVLANGNLIFAGGTSSNDGDVSGNKGGWDFWIVSTDASGNLLWSYCYGGSLDEMANDLASSGDTAFIAVGYTFSFDGDVSEYKDLGDAWMLYFDINGMFVTQKTKGGSDYDEFYSINSTANGGYILGGISYSNNGTVSGNHGGADAWLARLSKQGTEQWNFLFGTPADDAASYVAETAAGQFIIAGYSTLNNGEDYWFITTDDQGALLVSNTYGGSGSDRAIACFAPTATDAMMAGNSASPADATKDCAAGLSDAWLFKAAGSSLKWQKCLGGSGSDYMSRLISHGNQILTLAGYTNSTDQDISNPKGDYDFWLVKMVDGCDVAAGFTAQAAGGTAVFSNTSTSAMAYLWDFGDGNTSTAVNPVHSYSATGSYNVCLVAISACTTDTLCLSIEITCDSVQANFTYTANNQQVSFMAGGVNASSWTWHFGDGAVATGANVVHNYAAPGQYSVCLVAANFCSTDTFCQNITVTCDTVTAGFTYAANNLTVSFTSTSVNANKWKWKFGNGQNSSLENPTVNYAAPGSYDVCLVAANDCDTDTFCVTITVTCPVPSVAFSYTPNNLNVTFTNNTTNAVSWFWEFGDGNTSTLQDPQHTYLAEGTYEVCLTATNGCGSATLCSPVVVTCPLPVPSFSYQTNGLQVSLQNTSSGGTDQWWDFGDGNTSAAASPTHVFAAPGTYNVCLYVTNSCGTASYCELITVQCVPLTVGFTYSTDGLSVSLSSTVANAVSWFWTFGDGAVSTLPNPVHTYAAPGTYQVCLTASDGCTQGTYCETITVSCPAFTASFSYVITELTVQFTDESDNAITWLWNFGDGNTSALQNPAHTYALPGTYEVCLTASDGCTQQQTCSWITIVGTMIPDLARNIQVFPNPFTDRTTIRMSPHQGVLSVTLRNAAGLILRQHYFNEDHTLPTLVLERGNLPSGWYSLELRDNQKQYLIPVVIY